MIKNRGICCLFFILLTTINSAHAGSASLLPDGSYAGFSVGQSNLIAANDAEKFEDTNVRAFLGYQLSRYFAIESGIGAIPLEDVLGNVADLTGIDVSILATLPVTSRLSAYARFGYWDWNVSLKGNGSNYDLFGDTDMLYGIGLGYKLSPRIKLRVDAARFEATDAEVDIINGSIIYSF